ncbi:ATP-binding protein [Candidatus Latescibacterota bacterium]
MIFLVNRHTNSVIQLRFNEVMLLLEQQLDNRANILTAQGLVQSKAPRLIAALRTGDHETVLDSGQLFREQVGSELYTIIDQNGIVLARIHEPARWGDNVLSDSLVVNAFKGSSESGLLAESGSIYEVVVVPLISQGNVLTGALRLGFRIDDKFASILKRLTGTDVSFILDDKVVASSLEDDARTEIGTIIKQLTDESVHLRNHYELKQSFDIKLQNERFRCAFIELSAKGARYMIQRSIDEERAFQNNFILFILLVGLFSLPASLLVSAILSRSIAKPISQLAELSSRVAGGNLEVNFQTKSQDEIGDLANAFNYMTERLRAYVTELENHHRNLEKEVEKRTIELASANKMLEFRHRRLKVLSELSLEQFKDKIHLFETILDNACSLLEADIAILGMKKDSNYNILAVSGTDRDLIKKHLSLQQLLGRVTNEKERDIVIHDIHDDQSITVSMDKEVIVYNTIIRANIFVNDQFFGALCLLSKKKKAFANHDIEVLEILRKILTAELERKEWEQQLLAYTSEVEQANKAKSDFLANMSHELRTPLTAVIGFSQVLEMQHFGKLTEKQSEYVNNIHMSGKHLLSLINDILDLSKVEAGKMELELSELKAKELIEGSLVMIKEKCHKHNISLDLDISEEVSDLTITSDERKLKQIMFNLLSNASKFTPDNGAITIKADKIEEVLFISVTDTGIGITPENQEKIFDNFYQVKGGITDKTPGTGLGLALVKQLVELHGGTVGVESEGLRKGSKFSFTIPLVATIKESTDTLPEERTPRPSADE